MPSFTLLSSSGPQSGRCVGFKTTAGTFLRFVTGQGADPNTITLQRITSPSTAAQWAAAASTISTTARGSASCAVAQTGTTIRLFYMNHASNLIVFRDSTNDGVTWGAETATNGATLPGGSLCYGMFAPDINMVTAASATFSGFDLAAAALYRSINSAGWGAWVNGGPALSNWGQIRGLSCTPSLPNGFVYVAAGFQARTLQTGCAAGNFVEQYPSVPANYGQWFTVASMDNKNLGLTYAYPSISYDSVSAIFTIAAMLQDDGSVSGTAQSRVGIFQATDGQTYKLVGWIGNTMNGSACTATSGGILYIFDANNCYTMKSTPSSTDVTSDVLALSISEKLDSPQQLSLTLANQSGQHLFESAPNATISIAIGYNGTTIATHTAYLDSVAQVAGAENLVTEISGRSVSKFLEQVISKALIYSNQTIAQLIASIAFAAGVTLDPLPATSQFSQVVPCFMLQPGETWATALNRLGNVYGYTHIDRGVPSVTIVDPQAADASSWSYAQETLGLAWATHADQATLIRVIGQSTTTTPAFTDITDDTGILISGGERYRHIVDRNLTSAAQTKLRAQLAMRDEQRHSSTGTITVTINPAHELMDVITVTDARVGLAAQRMRIEGLDWHINMQSGEWLQHLHVALP